MSTSIKLTLDADADFAAIITFGIAQFGSAQAHDYAGGLIELFDRLAEHPMHYPRVGNYRRAVYRAHAVYFKRNADELLIVRILGRQDLSDAFLDID